MSLLAVFLMTMPVRGQFSKVAPERGGGPWLERPHSGETVDVLHYDLAVRLSMVDEQLSGTMRMAIRLSGTPADGQLRLHAAKLAIDSARVNGQPSRVTVDTLEESILLAPPPGTTFTEGETLEVAIDYRRVPGVARPSSRRGYYFFTDTLGLPANLGYTMSEPSDARFWMPCHDEPWDKATADIHARVPDGYVAASNGRLLGVENHPDATVTWHWREVHPIVPYLMCVTASRFTISGVPFERAPGDTVPVQYYVWEPDSLETALYLPTVRAMVARLSDLFGPYPFDKYGMTAIVPFGYGGMEHQTITTLNRYLKTDESVVLHELAHQWWGNLVTCGTWKDIWLNESFATYAEALWAESKGGAQALRAYMTDNLEHFSYGSWQGAVYDPEGQGLNLFDQVVYSKGAWVLHMLRGVVGDTDFFDILARYRERFSGGNATTADFEAVVDSVTGTSYSWFFSQWIYGNGWPKYSVSHTWTGDSLTVTLAQTQSASWPTFRMPLTLEVRGSGRDTTFVVNSQDRVATYTIPLAFSPDSVILDPEQWVLKQVQNTTVAVREDPVPGQFELGQNYPNPFNAMTIIRFILPVPARVRLGLYDMLGAEIAVLDEGSRPAGETVVRFNGSGLASGVYLYRLQAGPWRQTRRMLLIR